MAQAGRYQGEELLYDPINKTLRNRGYFSFVTAGVKRFSGDRGEFPLILGEGIIKKPDLVGFKWGNREVIEAVAVECKKGKPKIAVGEGLGEALIYQKFFPKVLIGMNDLPDKNVKRVLELYNLGWVTPRDAHIPLETNPSLSEKRFQEINVFGALALSFKSISEIDKGLDFEYYRIGLTTYPDGTYHRWICTYLKGPQYAIFVWKDKAQFVINIEHIRAFRAIRMLVKRSKNLFRNLLNEIGEFDFLLASIPKKQIMSYKVLMDLPCDEVDVEYFLHKVEELLKPKSEEKPYVKIYREIWHEGDALSKEDLINRMYAAEEALRSIYRFLRFGVP